MQLLTPPEPARAGAPRAVAPRASAPPASAPPPAATPDPRVSAAWGPLAGPQRVTWGLAVAEHVAEATRMQRLGFRIVHQQAHTRGGSVLYDAVWEPGDGRQEVAWGWLADDLRGDLMARGARGLLPALVHGYQHLDHGVRYTAVYEPADGDARVLLGVSAAQARIEWARWAPRGYGVRSLSAHADRDGMVRHSAVLRPGGPPQRLCLGLTAAEMVDECARQSERGFGVRHLTSVPAPRGNGWAAVFEPAPGGQVVCWAETRERVAHVHARERVCGFGLRALWTAPA